MTLKIKLCGFKNKKDIEFACKFDINFMGFIFYDKSPRNVDINIISKITSNIPKEIKKVAVLVDAKNAQIEKIIKELKPDLLQLHGDESLKRVQEIKNLFQIPIIKVFRVSSKVDLEHLEEFEEVANYYLFDTKLDKIKGGSGKAFDWNLLKNLNTKKEWFLSGGINKNNLLEAINISKANMIDVSSAIEEKKGIKSHSLIEDFIKYVKDN